MQVTDRVPHTKTSLEAPGRHALRIILGVLLVAVPALYILLVVILTPDVMMLNPGVYTEPCRLSVRTLDVAILVVVSYLGLNLLATPKHPVLFLRRFGLDVNSVVSRVIRKGLGRQFRFVTLDDGRFPAVDIPALERWTTRLGPPLAAILVIVGALAARQNLSEHPSSNGAAQQTAFQMSIVMGYWTGILWTLLSLGWVHSIRMRRKSHYRIRSDHQLNAFLWDIRHLSRWRLRMSLLQPQAIVARVSDALWQQCVSGVAEQFGMVLIDVSDPTPNLQWEIEVARGGALSCVFIGERTRLNSWREHTLGANTGTAAASVTELIGKDRVLLYEGPEKMGGIEFRRSLQQILRETSRQLQRGAGGRVQFPLMEQVWRMSLTAIFHVFLLFITFMSGTVIGLVVFELSKSPV